MTAARSAISLHKELERIYGSPPGWRGVLSAVNHSVIGMRFMVTALIFFLIGGVLAMLIRAQLATSGAAFLSAPAYAQVFTMHGVIMMFLFAIPLIEGFALYMLPKLLGSRDLAFPMLSAFGYWCYLFGGLILLSALAVGAAPDSGWFMYTPLSSQPHSPGINSDVWLIGVTFVEVSALCAAVEFMTTVVKVRAAGMALNKMPILVWYLWVTSAMMLFGFPPLILGSILLEVERAFGWPFFNPEGGGDPLLWQHLFWLFGHPEVYIIFLPGAGVISTVLPVFAGRPLAGYSWIVLAIIALGFHSFALWVHHMFTTGIPRLSLAFFSAASLLVVIPTAVQIFSWLATLAGGRPRLTTPMLYVYGFLSIFVLGGLTGVMVAIVPFDTQAHDTHFVVAHLHYVLVGGFVFPLLAGLYHWFSHFTGRTCPTNISWAAFALVFGGFNVAFLPMHWTGLLGMPRRVYTYSSDAGWDALNLVSSIGAFALAFGFALILLELLHGKLFGARAPRNPWRAGTFEWAMATPPPSYNFASLPTALDREPLHGDEALPAKLARGEGLLGEPRHKWRETIGVEPIEGRPDQIILLPGPTFIPLFTAAALGVFFLAFLFKQYELAVGGLALTIACVWWWLWSRGLKQDWAHQELGNGSQAPLHPASSDPPSLWGMRFSLMGLGVFFASLVFGHLFLWLAGPGAGAGIEAPAWTLWLGAGALLAATAGAALAQRSNSAGPRAAVTGSLLFSMIANFAAGCAFLAAALLQPTAPQSDAIAAGAWALCVFMAAQAAIGVFIAAYAAARYLCGWISAQRKVELGALLLWQIWIFASGVVSGALILFAR